METERKATPRQLAYIQQLRRRQGKESIELDENLSAQEASRMIEGLMGISPKNGYEREKAAPNTDEPFCAACRAEYRDSLYK